MAKFFRGLLTGSLIGGLGTLLFTPRSGKENRQMIEDYVTGITESAEDLSKNVGRLQGTLEVIATQGLELVTQVSQEISESLVHFQQENQPRIDRVERASKKLEEDILIEKEKIEKTLEGLPRLGDKPGATISQEAFEKNRIDGAGQKVHND